MSEQAATPSPATPSIPDLPASIAELIGVDPVAMSETKAEPEAGKELESETPKEEAADAPAEGSPEGATDEEKAAETPAEEPAAAEAEPESEPAEEAPDPAQEEQARAADQARVDKVRMLTELDTQTAALKDMLEKAEGSDGAFDPFSAGSITQALKVILKQQEALRDSILDTRKETSEARQEAVSAKQAVAAEKWWASWGKANSHVGVEKGQKMFLEELQAAQKKHGKTQTATAVAEALWEKRVAAVSKGTAPAVPATPKPKPTAAVPAGGSNPNRPAEQLSGMRVKERLERGGYR